jgi:hypothetical protein
VASETTMNRVEGSDSMNDSKYDTDIKRVENIDSEASLGF